MIRIHRTEVLSIWIITEIISGAEVAGNVVQVVDGDLQMNEDQEDADVVMDAHSKLKAPLSCGLGHQKVTYKHWTKVQCWLLKERPIFEVS